MFYRSSLSLFASILFSVSCLSFAHAGVSLKNGNFFITYKDVAYPGGFEPKVERVYNSKTDFEGIFGHGWGTSFETHLEVSADGSVILSEFGGGAENRFSPIKFDAKELARAVDQITAAARSTGAFGSPDKLKEYRGKLVEDASFRNSEWQKYVELKKLKPRKLAAGTQLVSNRFNFQYITKIKNGYARSYDGGKTEYFDEQGRLTRVQDKNKQFIAFSYDKGGKLSRIVDNLNRKMFFSFNSKGKVEQIRGDGGKQASYKYNDKNELVWIRGADGLVFEYRYAPNHNLSEIHYESEKQGGKVPKLLIEYWGKEKFGSVKRIVEKDGSSQEYDYAYDKADQGYRKIWVKGKNPQGKVVTQAEYEYFLGAKKNGEEWTKKLVTTLDGQRTETEYYELNGLPSRIKKSGEETRFEYDSRGRVSKKTTPTEITELTYHPKLGKVTKVVNRSLVRKGAVRWAEFQYDSRGNLTYAKNSEKKAVKLAYNRQGQVSALVDQDKRQILFKYNAIAKPVQITDPKLGTIHVTYDNAGEVKKVDSPKGKKVAFEVTSAFQNLLEIIRPAGVSLSF